MSIEPYINLFRHPRFDWSKLIGDCTERLYAMITMVTKYREYAILNGDAMPVSIQTALLLYGLCEMSNPDTILDLGSGFSSLVFSLAIKTNLARCLVSVDTKKQYKNLTEQFIKKTMGIDLSVSLWSDFKDNCRNRFDLVFHDIGTMSERAQYLPLIIDRWCKSGTILILDDIHKVSYRHSVIKALNKINAQIYDLHDLLHDHYGRFSYVVIFN